jgi:predicted amidohydrolase YtcJ
MPGLINNHCHLTIPGISGLSFKLLGSIKRQLDRNVEECLRHGVTTVRDMLGHAQTGKDVKAIVKAKEIMVNGGFYSSNYGMPAALGVQRARYWKFKDWKPSKVDKENKIYLYEAMGHSRKVMKK